MEKNNVSFDSKTGRVILSNEVFKNIAQIVCEKIDGVYSAKKDNDYVVCKINDNQVKLTLYIKLRQGIDVAKVCSKLQKKIHEDIMDMTGIDCHDISLDIQGFVSEK